LRNDLHRFNFRVSRLILGGDLSRRIGERGTGNLGEERGDGETKSKEKVENTEEKKLVEWIEENGWEVLNGNKQGDEEGEWTYICSRTETVIYYVNYVIVKEETWQRVEEFRIGERVLSDHHEIALRKRKETKEQ
jgi:hypothetical protein